MSLTAAERWAKARSFHHSLYSAERIAAEREQSVSVCLPARECAGTVGDIVGTLVRLREMGAIDEIAVVDAASQDGTATVAERAGAVVWQEAELMPSYGPVLGKGDAMWRALSVLGGELVCFLDADTEGFGAHFATGMLGPLVCEPGVSFVKAFYRRPFAEGGAQQAGFLVPPDQDRAQHLRHRISIDPGTAAGLAERATEPAQKLGEVGVDDGLLVLAEPAAGLAGYPADVPIRDFDPDLQTIERRLSAPPE